MNVLVVGTHPHVRQPSMSLFAKWLIDAVTPLGRAQLVAAPPVFLNARRKPAKAAKWLAYLDQYVLLPVLLAWRSRRFDLVIVADQGNAPSAILTPRRKLVVMVHDTIAMRQALGQITEAPRTGLTGVVLQALIRHSVKRARLLLSNPGTIPREISRLKLGKIVFVVGCPADYSRLKHCGKLPPFEGPYILNVAGDGWRKRKEALIPLWREVQKHSKLKLVLAGHTGVVTRRAFTAGGIDSVIFLDDIADSDLATLYANCEALVISSYEEGLCIPVLEAIQFDKQVFAPDITPSYVDFFGDAVSRIELSNPEIAAEQMFSALHKQPTSLNAASLREWATLEAFQSRVREGLAATKPKRQSQRIATPELNYRIEEHGL